MTVKIKADYRRGRRSGSMNGKRVVEAIESTSAEIQRNEKASELIFLNARDVCKSTSLSRAQLYRMVAAGVFPTAIPISVGRRVWVQSEINAWKEEQFKRARP